MKEYLNQFAVITLACKGNGEILDRNAAAEIFLFFKYF